MTTRAPQWFEKRLRSLQQAGAGGSAHPHASAGHADSRGGLRHAYQQSKQASCGAAVLLCAARELGVRDGYSRGVLALPDKEAEARIYGEAVATYGGGEGRLCYPSGLTIAGTHLGLRVEVYAVPSRSLQFTVGPRGVLSRSLIQSECEWCEAHGVPLHRSKHPTSGIDPGMRILKCVSQAVIGLHWVMLRPDGSVMEPYRGKNYESLEALNRQQGLGPKFHGTGLALSLR